MVQLSTCCGCFSVRTGSIIIAVLEILSSLYLFVYGIDATGQPQTKSTGLFFIFYSIVALMFSSLLIYGVINKMRNYMLPSIILRFIILVVNIIGLLIGIFAIEIVMSIINSDNHHKNIPEDAQRAIIAVRISLGIMLILATTLGTYLALIPLSYYNQLKFEENQPQVAFENAHSCSPRANILPPKYTP